MVNPMRSLDVFPSRWSAFSSPHHPPRPSGGGGNYLGNRAMHQESYGRSWGAQRVPIGSALCSWVAPHSSPSVGPLFQTRLSSCFWWPAMKEDIHRFVGTCPVYVQNKSSNARLVCYDIYLSTLVLGPKLPWTSWSVSLSPVSIRWSCPWLTASLKRPISLAFPNFLRTRRRPRFCWTRSAASKAFPRMWFRTEVLNLPPNFDNSVDGLALQPVCRLDCIHKPTGSPNAPTRIWVGFMASHNPASWSQLLTWVEYAHNSLPASTTGLSPFMCCPGYQPPLFPSQAVEAPVPSIQAFIQHCWCTWSRSREGLVRFLDRTKRTVDLHCRKAPRYVCERRVWLLTRDLPFKENKGFGW